MAAPIALGKQTGGLRSTRWERRARPPATKRCRAPLDARASGSALDRFDAVTDLDVLALSTPLGVFRSTDADGIVWVNRRFAEILGLSEDEVSGRDWMPLVHPLDRKRVEDAAHALFEAPARPRLCSSGSFGPTGSCGTCACGPSPARSMPGEPAAFVGAMEDVTETVRAEQGSSAASEGRSVPLARRRLGPRGLLLGRDRVASMYVNERWLEICAIRAEDLIGSDDLRVAHPDDRDAIFESMSAAALAGEEWFGEMRVLRPDGEIRHTRTTLAAIRDADGSVTGYVGTLEDVTDEAEDRQRGRAGAGGARRRRSASSPRRRGRS